MLKYKLRKKIFKLRQVANNNVKINFDKIIKLLKKEKINKKNIGGYYPVNFEVDDLHILKEFEIRKFNISLPIIKKNFDMNFYKWSFDMPLKINKYGIPEPNSNILIYPDVLLVPLVAFDKKLYRIGYGGGYYDRYIEKVSKKKKVFKVGIAHSCQKIKQVPTNQYDEKLDIIITEKYVLR